MGTSTIWTGPFSIANYISIIYPKYPIKPHEKSPFSHRFSYHGNPTRFSPPHLCSSVQQLSAAQAALGQQVPLRITQPQPGDATWRGQRLNGSTARYKWVRILVISDGYSRVITWDIGFFQVLDGSFHLLDFFKP
jgi:hypothetical protein